VERQRQRESLRFPWLAKHRAIFVARDIEAIVPAKRAERARAGIHD
jgi:hypothetical protein